jgi:hypothetical protein
MLRCNANLFFLMNVGRYSMWSYDMRDEARGEVLRFHGVIAGYEMRHFRQSVHHYPQGVASFGRWQSGDEIH